MAFHADKADDFGYLTTLVAGCLRAHGNLGDAEHVEHAIQQAAELHVFMTQHIEEARPSYLAVLLWLIVESATATKSISYRLAQRMRYFQAMPIAAFSQN